MIDPADDWVVISPASLHWVQWETDTSLFNADTGETHLLSELPVEALRFLSTGRQGFGVLCEHLARLCEVDNDGPWQQRTRAMLLTLADLELVEQPLADDR